MNKLAVLVLSAALVPALAAPALADLDHPAEAAPAQFHRDMAQFHRDGNNNNPPAAQSQTQVKLYRVEDSRGDNNNNGRDDNRRDNDHRDNRARTDQNDNGRHDGNPGDHRNSRDWGRDHNQANDHRDNNTRRDNTSSNNTRVIIKDRTRVQTTHRNWRGWDHDRDIRNFRTHDYAAWRGGRWQHGRHNGRDGWWWAVGNLLYFYSQPVYPYPDPYAPPVVIESTSYAPGYWYYCADPSGYYPYVADCYVPWRAVPQ